MSPRHRDALAHLLYGIGSGGGFILLTGEVGTGKTTINRALLSQLPDTTDIAIVLNPALSAAELLATVCDELGAEYPKEAPTLKALTDALHQFLLSNYARGRKTVLMIDEAQHLDFDVLEQIRLLTNLETDEQKLLQIVLIGQPELSAKLGRPELRQLNQRITARFNLSPLSADETVAYIAHRLHVAGRVAGGPLFSPSALRRIHQLSQGTPRLINLICDRALIGAYGQGLAQVDRKMVVRAADEVMGTSASHRGTNASQNRWLVPSIVAVVLVVAVGIWMVKSDSVPGSENDAAAVVTPVPDPIEQTAASSVVRSGWELPTGTAEKLLWMMMTNDPMPARLCQSGTRWQCESMQSKTWDAVAAWQQPVLLSLRSETGDAAILLTVDADFAVLLDPVSGVKRVPLLKLTKSWTGDYLVLWQPPAEWRNSLSQGDTSALVSQLAEAFAQLDQQDETLDDDGVFGERLGARVVLFQAEEGLNDSGVVDALTWVRLQQRLGRGLSGTAAVARAEALHRDGLLEEVR